MPYPDKILMKAEKPARYIGNEINAVVKNAADVDVRFAFCFPDTYEIGMSHLGLQILYFFINRRDDAHCERVFAPNEDMENLLREHKQPLLSLETGSPLTEFDFLGFTLQYEMSYTNVLNMLDLAGIPLLTKDRTDDMPLVCAGGPCTYNPEPMADFVDFFYIGEAEHSLDAVFDLYATHKQAGGGKQAFLEKLLAVEGIYVPQFYDVEYNADGTISSFAPNHPAAPTTVKKVIAKDMNTTFVPDKHLVPLIETVHDRAAMEVFRGCIRGCRFCQAGFVYRPVRERGCKTLLEQAESLIQHSGHEEISLLSLSTSDYTELGDLAKGLNDRFKSENVSLSLPSLRVDSVNLDLMNEVGGVRKSTLTFAPEAGSQRMRDVINKNLSEEQILNGVALAISGGWLRFKLYFMMGLPTETDEDLVAICDLADKIVAEHYKIPKEERMRPIAVNISTSCFVPKPFTPFQWAAQNSMAEFTRKAHIIKDNFPPRIKKRITYNYHNSDVSTLEAAFARGDRRLGAVILSSWQLGAKMDSWNEKFKLGAWQQAFAVNNLVIEDFANRERALTEILPWDFIDIGVAKQFLMEEYTRAMKQETTPDCRSNCSACGAQKFGAGLCFSQ